MMSSGPLTRIKGIVMSSDLLIIYGKRNSEHIQSKSGVNQTNQKKMIFVFDNVGVTKLTYLSISVSFPVSHFLYH